MNIIQWTGIIGMIATLIIGIASADTTQTFTLQQIATTSDTTIRNYCHATLNSITENPDAFLFNFDSPDFRRSPDGNYLLSINTNIHILVKKSDITYCLSRTTPQNCADIILYKVTPTQGTTYQSVTLRVQQKLLDTYNNAITIRNKAILDYQNLQNNQYNLIVDSIKHLPSTPITLG